MIQPSITLYELASLRHAELLRDAAEHRLRNTASQSRSPRQSWLPGIFDAIAAAFHREQIVTAAGWSR